MMIIRAVERRDLADLRALARKSGVGLTTLPDNEETLSARIERAIKTWQGSFLWKSRAICSCWRIPASDA